MNHRAVFAAVLLSGIGAAGALSTAQTRPATAAKPDLYEIDPVHSTIIFRIDHLGVSRFYGRINGPFGEFRFDPDNPGACAFEITVRAKSVDTGNPRRDGHIKSADFFNATQFPEITFKSSEVTRADGNPKNIYRVTGDLTLHGVTKAVTVDLEHVATRDLPRFGHRSGFHTSFTINRSEFGVDHMPGMLGEEVLLLVGIEGQRK